MMTVQQMRERKKQLHYTNEKIAELSGVPLGTVQKIFGGATSYPRLETMEALEKVLGSPKDHVVRETPATYGSSAIKEEFPDQGNYTVDDYRAMPAWPRHELIDGVLIEMEAPTTMHQTILGQFYVQFQAYISGNQGTCRVFFAPLDVQLDCDDKTMLQPDLMVVCGGDKTKEWGIWGAPDFVLEILSPSTKKKDMVLKYRKYKEAGVREYWLVDPEGEIVLTYFFDDEGKTGVYGFDSKIPVWIYNGELEIDFTEIAKWL